MISNIFFLPSQVVSPDAHCDPQTMAKLALGVQRLTGADNLGVPFCITRGVILHICGDTSDRLDLMADSGAVAISLDNVVDLAFAKKQVGNRVLISGNVSPVTTMLMGTPEDVMREARNNLRQASGLRALAAAGDPAGRREAQPDHDPGGAGPQAGLRSPLPPERGRTDRRSFC
jgi:uroporphyrinogen-III decarboxylase